MSRVTNVMLHYGLRDDDKLPQINEKTAPLNNGQEFRDICGSVDTEAGSPWGGAKYPEVALVAAAFNYWDQEATVLALAALSWEEPGLVQLFICDQEDDAFSLYTLHWLEETPHEKGRLVWVQMYNGADL